MAEGYNEKIILKNEETFDDGYRVQYDFVVDNLTTRKMFVLDQEFFTRCEWYSTSWKFRMEIQPVGVNGNVNIPVILARFDTSDCVANASINVSLSNSRGETVLPGPRNFVKPGMESGDELTGYISGYLQPSDPRILFNQMLTVRVIIAIHDYNLAEQVLLQKIN